MPEQCGKSRFVMMVAHPENKGRPVNLFSIRCQARLSFAVQNRSMPYSIERPRKRCTRFFWSPDIKHHDALTHQLCGWIT